MNHQPLFQKLFGIAFATLLFSASGTQVKPPQNTDNQTTPVSTPKATPNPSEHRAIILAANGALDEVTYRYQADTVLATGEAHHTMFEYVPPDRYHIVTDSKSGLIIIGLKVFFQREDGWAESQIPASSILDPDRMKRLSDSISEIQAIGVDSLNGELMQVYQYNSKTRFGETEKTKLWTSVADNLPYKMIIDGYTTAIDASTGEIVGVKALSTIVYEYDPSIKITYPDKTISLPTPTASLLAYTFPESIDLTKPYIFYLHGKIIEDQGLEAISPDFGKYEYLAILEKLASYGYVVISEQRARDTDGMEYARGVADQINRLLEAGIPQEHITVVGASQGAAIAAAVSYYLKKSDVKFVLIGTCYPGMAEEWKQNQMHLYGNILAIYDSIDTEYAGSCEELFAYSAGKGIGRYKQLVLQTGLGHGVLYTPLDAWILPTTQWAEQ